MEIILREDVQSLGKAGALVRVKPGYARNYLLPQGLAYEATEGNKKRIAAERKAREAQLAHDGGEAGELGQGDVVPRVRVAVGLPQRHAQPVFQVPHHVLDRHGHAAGDVDDLVGDPAGQQRVEQPHHVEHVDEVSVRSPPDLDLAGTHLCRQRRHHLMWTLVRTDEMSQAHHQVRHPGGADQRLHRELVASVGVAGEHRPVLRARRIR